MGKGDPACHKKKQTVICQTNLLSVDIALFFNFGVVDGPLCNEIR